MQVEYLEALQTVRDLDAEKAQLEASMRSASVSGREGLREQLGRCKEALRQATPVMQKLQDNEERVRYAAYKQLYDRYDVETFLFVDSRQDRGVRELRQYLQQVAMRQPWVTDTLPRQYVRLMEVLRILRQDVCAGDI